MTASGDMEFWIFRYLKTKKPLFRSQIAKKGICDGYCVFGIGLYYCDFVFALGYTFLLFRCALVFVWTLVTVFSDFVSGLGAFGRFLRVLDASALFSELVLRW